MAVYAVRDKDKEEALKLAGHLGVEMITAGNVQKNDGLMRLYSMKTDFHFLMALFLCAETLQVCCQESGPAGFRARFLFMLQKER